MAYQEANISSSFFDKASFSYSDALSIELVELQRTIYLPLLPMERLTYSVLVAYEEEGIPYWFKDEVYTSVMGNFYAPMMFPMVENPEESIDMIHSAPHNSMLKTEGAYETVEYTTSTYVQLVIPKYIVMNFTDTIPKGTVFVVGAVGGSNTIDQLKILSVAWLPTEVIDENYAGEGGEDGPKETRGKRGNQNEELSEKESEDFSSKNVEEGREGKRYEYKADTGSRPNNSARGRSTKSSGSGSSNVLSAPSPFSTIVDLSGLNMATVRKKVHEDLELIREETIRRQKLNSIKEIVHG